MEMSKQEFVKSLKSNIHDTLIYEYGKYAYSKKDKEHLPKYLKEIQGIVPSAFKMTTRPFGFVAKCSDGEVSVFLKIAKGRIETKVKSKK